MVVHAFAAMTVMVTEPDDGIFVLRTLLTDPSKDKTLDRLTTTGTDTKLPTVGDIVAPVKIPRTVLVLRDVVATQRVSSEDVKRTRFWGLAGLEETGAEMVTLTPPVIGKLVLVNELAEPPKLRDCDIVDLAEKKSRCQMNRRSNTTCNF